MSLRAWSCSSRFFWAIIERNIWKSSVARIGWKTAWKKIKTADEWMNEQNWGEATADLLKITKSFTED